MKDIYNSLKKYLDSSLYEIDEELNLCTNETYKTFIQKFEEFQKILFHLMKNKIKMKKKI